MVDFSQLADRLSAEAKDLLRQMVSMHLESTGDRLFVEMNTSGGNTLVLTGRGSNRSLDEFDVGALEDLVRSGLLQKSYGGRGTTNFRIGSDALSFHRYLMEQEGGAVAQVEDALTRFTAGDVFARDHARAAHHLQEAFALLWSGHTDDQTASEVGDHLRKALIDLTTDIVGDDGMMQEEPIARLDTWLEGLSLGQREMRVVRALVDLARATLELDHRLNHVRDEADKGEPPVTWEEMRRAAFVTAMVCHELGAL